VIMSKRELIENAIQDLVIDFLVYDRNEDEELSSDDIKEAVRSGEITVDAMTEIFRAKLNEYF
jgi:predicted RNA-binding protein associated with RNAse of E/G family